MSEYSNATREAIERLKELVSRSPDGRLILGGLEWKAVEDGFYRPDPPITDKDTADQISELIQSIFSGEYISFLPTASDGLGFSKQHFDNIINGRFEERELLKFLERLKGDPSQSTDYGAFNEELIRIAAEDESRKVGILERIIRFILGVQAIKNELELKSEVAHGLERESGLKEKVGKLETAVRESERETHDLQAENVKLRMAKYNLENKVAGLENEGAAREEEAKRLRAEAEDNNKKLDIGKLLNKVNTRKIGELEEEVERLRRTQPRTSNSEDPSATLPGPGETTPDHPAEPEWKFALKFKKNGQITSKFEKSAIDVLKTKLEKKFNHGNSLQETLSIDLRPDDKKTLAKMNPKDVVLTKKGTALFLRINIKNMPDEKIESLRAALVGRDRKRDHEAVVDTGELTGKQSEIRNKKGLEQTKITSRSGNRYLYLFYSTKDQPSTDLPADLGKAIADYKALIEPMKVRSVQPTARAVA